jgi:hypothetical protein
MTQWQALKDIFAAGSVLIAVALCLWFMIDGLRTGVLKGKRPVARAREPKFFWIMMATYGALPVFIIALVVWGALRSH